MRTQLHCRLGVSLRVSFITDPVVLNLSHKLIHFLFSLGGSRDILHLVVS